MTLRSSERASSTSCSSSYETGAIDDVMNGNLDGFTVAYLKMQ